MTLDTTAVCPCGRVYDIGDGLGLHHESSDEHAQGVIERWTKDEWVDFVDAIANGLGWADSEDMGHGDSDEIVAVVQALIKRAKQA